ncbi:MAG: L-glutamate gamma-semialdehyde dehydrogenase, partial [Bacteroidota bacterium]
MPNALFSVPKAVNEPVYSYAPGTPERARLLGTYERMLGECVDIPMFIGGREVRTGELRDCRPPHDHQRVIGRYHWGTAAHVQEAVDAALAAHAAWSSMPWFERAGIFLRAADLVSGPYRATLNAATMLAQSKTVHQAEIDAACEFADFLRFNVQFMTEIYAQQPESSPGVWNRMEYRALEGFILAITPFNFTAIAGNLPSAPALMGNVAVWKPADTQIYSAWVIMEVFRKAGLPDGVINLVYADGPAVGDVVFKHPDFAGLHFTGSTGVFKHLWKEIGTHIDRYKAYPRIVGETGGKDFVLAHPSADAAEVATSLSRGAFE